MPSTETAAETTLDEATVTDTTARALARIQVRPPYFGLTDVEEVGPGLVTATVPAAPPTLPELGAIEAAQVARHLAILGSCAAALARDDESPHHYLAVEAHYVRAPGSPDDAIGGPLRGEAVASWIDKRTARAVATLSDPSGRRLNVLEVTYAAMTPRMLSRLYPPTPVGPEPGADGEAEPGRPLGDEDLEPVPGGVRVDWGAIPTQACAGHFPGLPAAPVAVVMGHLCRTAGLGLARELGGEVAHRIEAGHVVAAQLARAGQRLVLEATYDRCLGADTHVMHGIAAADGEVVGKVDVTFSTAPLGSD